ncbi:ATP-binding protein [Dechloromonas sp. XY25]|uniref:ATP-binding protein n=1 Tax=Dechloromonas hankyongensis TaxID=2908002 RepID=A0ABS9JZY3_9RHOO|nr:ATP-binding protein [Dechloromonas hankyongensis]MCG2576467.1 ATP-binding protein [Dechloromonas hankyongensis]
MAIDTLNETYGAAGSDLPAASPAPSVAPPAPRRLADTGLETQLLLGLIGKLLILRGNQRLIDLAQHLRLPAGIVEELLDFMRAERLVELLRRGAAAGDADYGLTERGRGRAADALRKCRYAGPAPVTLGDYAAQVRRQSVADMRVTRAEIADAYRDTVVRGELRDLIGTAMNSGRPMFFYGPSGSGKTYLAESLVRLIRGTVYVPYALAVDGEIIQVFDPLIHRPLPAEAATAGLDNRARIDERWVACARPVAISGGELTLDRLNLQYDRVAGLYQAPAHVKANNGLYIIDDLGRQQVSPEQLMNRWIVPMDRRRDYLALHTGSSFEIPFDVKLVFSTNLTPEAIADEAFLRRLGYKIYVGPLGEGEYEQIFRQVCAEFGIAFSAATFQFLLTLHRRMNRMTFACYPRDLIAQVRDYATYREWPIDLTPQLIEWAWHGYFAQQ